MVSGVSEEITASIFRRGKTDKNERETRALEFDIQKIFLCVLK
jgi:hypothetical protein